MKTKTINPRVLAVAFAIAIASAGLAACLGASLEMVSIMLFVLAVAITVIIENITKPLLLIILLVACTIFASAGPDALTKLFPPGPTSAPPTPVITPVPVVTLAPATPTPPEEGSEDPGPVTVNHAVQINENAESYYGAKILKNIRATRRMLYIGKYSTFKLDTSMDKLCRRFTIDRHGTLSFDLLVNEQDEAEFRDIDDWIVSIMKSNKTVLYEGIVNRAESPSHFDCELDIGNYYLVIQRTTNNHAFRVIDVDSTFHVN